MVLRESSLDGVSLLHSIDKALRLQNDTPFKITREHLLENIQAHTNKIYDIALKNLEKSFIKV